MPRVTVFRCPEHALQSIADAIVLQVQLLYGGSLSELLVEVTKAISSAGLITPIAIETEVKSSSHLGC